MSKLSNIQNTPPEGDKNGQNLCVLVIKLEY
jgi:hypothetical protein